MKLIFISSSTIHDNLRQAEVTAFVEEDIPQDEPDNNVILVGQTNNLLY